MSRRSPMELLSLVFLVCLGSAPLAYTKDTPPCPYKLKNWDGPIVKESLYMKLSKTSRSQKLGYLLAEYKRPAAESFALPILYHLAATDENPPSIALFQELGLEVSGGVPLYKAIAKYPARVGFQTGKRSTSELCNQLVLLKQKAEK